MTRRQIAVEKMEDILPGQFLIEGALWWDDEHPIHIVWPGNHFDPLGKAIDIQREKDGIITAELEFFRDKVSEKAEEETFEIYGATTYATNVESHVFNGVRFFTKARIREVFLTYDVPWAPAWPYNPAANPVIR